MKKLYEEADFEVPGYKEVVAFIKDSELGNPTAVHNKYIKVEPKIATLTTALEKFNSVKGNKLNSSQAGELRRAIGIILGWKKRLPAVVAAYKKQEVEARPAALAQKHAEAAKPKVHTFGRALDRIRGASEYTPESFEWKDRVREYLGEGKIKLGFHGGEEFKKSKKSGKEDVDAEDTYMRGFTRKPNKKGEEELDRMLGKGKRRLQRKCNMESGASSTIFRGGK